MGNHDIEMSMIKRIVIWLVTADIIYLTPPRVAHSSRQDAKEGEKNTLEYLNEFIFCLSLRETVLKRTIVWNFLASRRHTIGYSGNAIFDKIGTKID